MYRFDILALSKLILSDAFFFSVLRKNLMIFHPLHMFQFMTVFLRLQVGFHSILLFIVLEFYIPVLISYFQNLLFHLICFLFL